MDTLLEVGLSNAVAACVPAVVAVIVGLFCRRPALVHALWLLVLVKLVTPPLVRIPLPWPAAAAVAAREEEPAVAEPRAPAEPEEDEEEPLPEEADEIPAPQEEDAEPAPEPMPAARAEGPGWPGWINAAWLAGSLGWFGIASRRVWRFHCALRHARPAPADLAGRVEQLARSIGLGGGPPVWLVPGRLSPMIWGVVRPVLLVPEGLAQSVDPAGIQTLLVHELAHLRRRDHWVRLLEFIALGLFWWNPVAWYARRELHEAEEHCCDAWVPRVLPGTARAYATALVDVLDFLSESRPALPPLACGVGQVDDLKRRLTMILRGTTPHGLGWLAGLVVFGLAAFLLPLVPGIGQAQDEKPRTTAERLRELGALREADDDLNRAKDELKRKMAEIEELKKKIIDIAKAKAKERKPQVHSAAGAASKGVTIRIEISGLSGSSEEISKLARELEKALGGKDKKVIVQVGGHRLDVRTLVGDALRGRMVVPAPRLRTIRPGERVQPPAVPGTPARPATPPPPGAHPGGRGSSDGLEKKVDALLRELEALRNELKGRRMRGPGEAPGPGAGPRGRGPGPGGPARDEAPEPRRP